MGLHHTGATAPCRPCLDSVIPQSSMIRLITLDPVFAGQVCELPDGLFTVGRRGDNDLVIAHPTVSATHCKLLLHGSEIIVRDAGSLNGTYVDGRRVRGQSGIVSRQCLQVGDVRLEVQVQPGSDSGEEWDASTPLLNYRRWLRPSRNATGVRPWTRCFLVPEPPTDSPAADAGEQ